jgi:hypothetical protein
MRSLYFSFFMMAMTVLGCETEKVGLATQDLGKTATVTQINGTTASCQVTFYKKSTPATPLKLEDDAAVACNGYMATFNNGVYTTWFPNTSLASVLLTVVRPTEGAVSSEYVNF